MRVGLSDFKILRRVLGMTLRYRAGMGIALGTAVTAAVFQLMIPKYLGRAVDGAQGLLGEGGDPAVARAALWQAAAMLIGASILRGLFTMMQNFQGEAVGQLHRLRAAPRLLPKLQRLSFGFHDRVHSGDLITRGMLDIEGVRCGSIPVILRIVLLTILIGCGAMHPAADRRVARPGGAVLRAVRRHLAPRSRGCGCATPGYALQEELSALTRIMEENLGGIRVVRAFAAQAFELARFDRVSDGALAISQRRVASVRRATPRR